MPVATLKIERQPAKTIETRITPPKPAPSRAYAPPETLPFDRLHIRAAVTEADTEARQKYNDAVDKLAAFFSENAAPLTLDVLTVDFGTLAGEKSMRAKAVLESLQEAYRLASEAIELCRQFEAGWRTEGEKLREDLEKETKKSSAALRRLHATIDEKRLSGLASTTDAVKAVNRSIEAARRASLGIAQAAENMATTRSGILDELTAYVALLRK